MTPLRMSNILPDGDINAIFSNVQLLLGVNRYLASSFHVAGTDAQRRCGREFYENLNKKVLEHSEVSANLPIGGVFARLVHSFTTTESYLLLSTNPHTI